jgi:DedD protein
MNQELKQRLIGAVVITALAAIFIPMLFDDPIENSGQSVSELVIPATPVITGEVSANKLPTNANQVLNAPDSGSENVINTDEETELSTENQSPSETPIADEPVTETTQKSDQAMDEPVNDGSSNSLDTGVVSETNQPTKPVKAKPQTNIIKQQSTQEPDVEAPIVAVKPIKKPINAEVVPSENNLNKPAKPKTEFSRWTIQAGSFSKKENAVSLMETLRKQGLPVTLDTIKTASNTPLYRLKIGPTLDKKRAAEMKAKLDGQKIQSLLIAE